jgi:hypothetical protein
MDLKVLWERVGLMPFSPMLKVRSLSKEVPWLPEKVVPICF